MVGTILKGVLAALREALRSFVRNDDFKTSAALAFLGILASMPMLLLVLYILSHYIISSGEAIKGLSRILSLLLPQLNDAIIREAYTISRRNSIWGLVSLGILIWSITPLTSALRDAFIVTFSSERHRPFIREKLLDIIAVTFILGLLIGLVVSEVVYTRIVRILFSRLPLLLYLSNMAGPLILSVGVLSAFYLIFSPVRLQKRHLLTGSTATAIIWLIIRPVFTIILIYNPGIGFAFGSLKAIFIILTWILVSFMVLMLGAEIIASLNRLKPVKTRVRGKNFRSGRR